MPEEDFDFEGIQFDSTTEPECPTEPVITEATCITLVEALPAPDDERFTGELCSLVRVIASLRNEISFRKLAVLIEPHTGHGANHQNVTTLTSQMKRERSALDAIQRVQRKEAEERPSELKFKDYCIWLDDTKIADFVAQIVGTIIVDDSATTTRQFLIEGILPDHTKLRRIEVPAQDYHEMSWVIELWGTCATMRTGCWGQVAEAILRKSHPVEVQAYSHFGWRDIDGERTFLLPRGGISKKGLVKVHVRAPKKLERYSVAAPPDNKEEGVKSVVSILGLLETAPLKISAPLLLSMFLAPLTEILGPTIFIWIHGPSGSMKTSIVSLMMSFYGDFDYRHPTESWFSTQNFMETTLWRAKDVPILIDNLVPAQTGRGLQELLDKAVRLIQTYGDGTSRGRLDPSANEKDPRPPRCLPIATAEQLPPGNASTMARVLCVQSEGVNRKLVFSLSNDPEKRALLQMAGAGYLRHLSEREPSEIKAMHLKARQDVLTDFAEVIKDETHLRLIETMALLRVAQECLYGYIRSVIPEKHQEAVVSGLHTKLQKGLVEILKDQIIGHNANELDGLAKGSSRTIPAAQQFLECVRGLLLSGEYGLAKGANGQFTQPGSLGQGERWIPRIGWLVDGEVWLYQEAAYQAVNHKLGGAWLWRKNELVHQLKTLLLQCAKDRPSAVKSTSIGPRTRVWVLSSDNVLGEESTYEGVQDVGTAGLPDDGSYP